MDDEDLNPIACAEQFADADPAKAQPPEELLRRARLILSTELGKDPLLRNHIRKIFREDARVSVEPTERGITKIDENHPYFVCHSLCHVIFPVLTKSQTELQVPSAKAYCRYVGNGPIPAYPGC